MRISAVCNLKVVTCCLYCVGRQKTRQVIVLLISTNTEIFADKLKGSNDKCGVVWWHQRTCSYVVWCCMWEKVLKVAHISKIQVEYYIYLCQFHFGAWLLLKNGPKNRAWFVCEEASQVIFSSCLPFSCLSSTWEMYSMQLHGSWVLLSDLCNFPKAVTGCHLRLLLSGWMGNILYALCKKVQLQQCVLRQRSKPTCRWLVSCEASDSEARAPLQHTMPSVCEKEPATIKTLPLCWVISTLVTMNL